MISPQANKVHEGVRSLVRVEREGQLQPKMNHHTLVNMHKETRVHKQAGERAEGGTRGEKAIERKRTEMREHQPTTLQE